MDSKQYFQSVHSLHRRGAYVPMNGYRTNFLGFSISDTENPSVRYVSLPQGMPCSPRQSMIALHAAQAQIFNHLPLNFVWEQILNHETKFSGG